MTPNFRVVVAIVLISLGGVMLGRTLSRWAQRKLTRVQLLAGLLSGIAAAAMGASYRMNRATHPSAEWIQIGCTLLFIAAILIDTRERSRLNP